MITTFEEGELYHAKGTDLGMSIFRLHVHYNEIPENESLGPM